jgi:hypothetical protein
MLLLLLLLAVDCLNIKSTKPQLLACLAFNATLILLLSLLGCACISQLFKSSSVCSLVLNAAAATSC